MTAPRDTRSLTDVSAELARRWATQRLNAVQAYGRILADFGAGRSTSSAAAGAYARLVAEEAVRYPADAIGLATDFAAALVRKAGGKLETFGEAQAPFQDIEMSGPLGGTATAEFALRNPHDRSVSLGFVAGAFSCQTGETSATVVVTPSHLDLAPGDEQTVTLTANLDPKVFETGGRYTANVAITGFDDLVLRVRLTVLPA
jgi:hypothetical protein